jgi:signal transduction histidine kinase
MFDYLKENVNHVAVVFLAAMIAIARKAIILDVKAVSGITLVGSGAIVITLSAGYHLIQKKRDGDRKILKQLEKDRYLTGLGQAAATIVRDLKTPLLAILGFARRLQAGKGDPDTGLQTIGESALFF